MGTIVFLTYPPALKDYDKWIENDEYDNQLRAFEVPIWWASEFVFITWRMGLADFIDEYTWDDSYEMYLQAAADGIVISEKITE